MRCIILRSVGLLKTRSYLSCKEFASFREEIQDLFDQCCTLEMGCFGFQLKDSRQAMTILDFHEVHLFEENSVVLAFKNATFMQNGKMIDEDLAKRIIEVFPEKFVNKA